MALPMNTRAKKVVTTMFTGWKITSRPIFYAEKFLKGARDTIDHKFLNDEDGWRVESAACIENRIRREMDGRIMVMPVALCCWFRGRGVIFAR